MNPFLLHHGSQPSYHVSYSPKPAAHVCPSLWLPAWVLLRCKFLNNWMFQSRKNPPETTKTKSPITSLSPQISSWMCIFLRHSISCHKLQIRASYNVWHSRAACGFHQVRTRCSLHVCIHRTMENQFMHPFKPNNSYITALVQGQAAASIAVISPKWSCIWFYHLWGDIDSCTYVCQTLQCMLSLDQTFEHS